MICPGRLEKMNAHENEVGQGENGIELGVPEAVRHYDLSAAEITHGWTLESLEPSRLPDILLLLCNLTLLCQVAGFSKTCSASDVSRPKNRLLIPVADATNHILEHVPLLGNGESIPIRVYTAGGKFYRLLFKHIDDKYIITHREVAPGMPMWIHVRDAIGLQKEDRIKLWSLRHNGTNELSFLIVKQQVMRG